MLINPSNGWKKACQAGLEEYFEKTPYMAKITSTTQRQLSLVKRFPVNKPTNGNIFIIKPKGYDNIAKNGRYSVIERQVFSNHFMTCLRF